MTADPPEESRYDLIYGRIRLGLIQGLGVAGLIYEFFMASHVEPLLLATAVTLVGIPVTRVLDKVFK